MTKLINASLFTHGVDPGLADLVRRIPSKHTHFATEFMGYLNEGDAAPAATRLEAVLDPATETWQIDRFTKMPNELNAIRQQIEARPGLCFFDALDYLTRFENTEAELGKQPVTVIGLRWNVPHYRQAANDSNQVFDNNGMLQPCAHGRILTEGFFTPQAFETAGFTRTTSLLKTFKVAKDQFLNDIIFGLIHDQPVSEPTDILLQKSVKRKNAINNIDGTLSAWDYFLEYNFKNYLDIPHKPERTLKEKVFTPVKTLKEKVLMRSEPDLKPQAYNYLHDCKLWTAVLPSGPEKELCLAFSKAAEIAVAIEIAAKCFNNTDSQNIKIGLPYIEEAARLSDLSPVDAERLKASYLNGLTKSGEQLQKLKEWWDPPHPHNSDAQEKIVWNTRKQASVRSQLQQLKTHLQSLEL